MTYAAFRLRQNQQNYKGEILVLGQSSSGLELAVKRPEGYYFYTVTDLSSGLIVRNGSETMTLALNSLTTFVNVTLDPALPNTTDFRAWGNPRTATSTFGSGQVSCAITTTTNLQVRLSRSFGAANLVVETANLSFASGTDGESAPGDPHNHGLALLTENHLHTLALSIAAATVVADWWIARIII